MTLDLEYGGAMASAGRVDLAAALRDAGLRVTASRVAVLSVVTEGKHVTADQVALAVRDRVGTISTQAVYDVLGALTRAGLVRRIEPAGSPARYETRVGDNHHHAVCRSCGAIIDVDCVVGEPPCVWPCRRERLRHRRGRGHVLGSVPYVPDNVQIPREGERQMTDKPPRTTTDAGIPVASDEFSLTVGPDGPILLQDQYLIEQMANFNRERIAERQPHAKGSGAFGVFETTEDVSAYTRAALFQPGVKTEMLARFSTVAGESGSPDTWRDPRGFALKFYTTEGNYDMVGNNTPVFFVRDPMKFQHFIRSQKRRADNGLRDHDMQWDFWTLSPESAPPGDVADGRPRYPEDLPPHERLLEPHLHVGQCRRRQVLGQVPLQDRSGDRVPDPGGRRPDGRREPRLPPAGPVRGDPRRRLPELDAAHADHALRGRQDLSVQPVRPDQGVAPRATTR